MKPPAHRLFYPLLALIAIPLAHAEEPITVGGTAVASILERLGARLEHGVSQEEMDAYSQHFDRVDEDQDGRHSQTEYIDNGTYLSPQARRGIFFAADADKDGEVTKAEYTLNRIITDEAKAIVQAMDDDGNRVVQREEFVKHADAMLSDSDLTSSVFAALDTSGDGEIVVPEYLRIWGQWARVGYESPERRLKTASEPANESDPAKLTLERIFVEKEFKSKSFNVQWREEGASYTFLTDSDDGHEIAAYVPETETTTVLVDLASLTPVESGEPLPIENYTFSKDESLVLIYTNSKRVWRRNTRGDYWILDRSSGELRQLGGDAPESSLMFAKISPTGDHVAYVRDRNIYVEGLLDHSIRAVTTTPTDKIINGTSDWVYEEELGVRDGFRWSPDGASIAYWQFDESGVRHYTLVDHVSGLYPEVKTFGYPKVGQRNASVRIGVVSVNGSDTRWMDVPGDPRDHYIAKLEWTETTGQLVIQQLNRAQNTLRVMLANPINNSVGTILTEQDQAWVDTHNEMHWVDDGRKFTWISERDGWRHLYLMSRDGEGRCLTPGEFDVIRLLRVDQEDQWAYFIASPDNPAERYLYRVGLDGENLTRLTPTDATPGTHAYNVSPDGNFAISTTSNYDTPPVTSLITLPDHESIKVLEDNDSLKEKADALKRSETEFFYVDIGTDQPLHTRCIKPPGFDPAQKYPLFIHVYGEPAGQVVTNRWGGSNQLWHWMLAQEGYVIMSFDNRGTAAPRGRAWRKAAHHKIGVLAPKDQAAAVRAVLKDRPYLDPERVGIWGWSGGGSMSLNAIFKYPELYHTAIAVASVPNQRYYDTIYQERYMGLPGENVEGYREGSPINFAHQLEGNLLIVHGAADDNCHYQTFEKLVDKLIQHNKPFSMMTYPRGTHSIKEGKNTTLHLYSLMTRFLHQNLPRD